MEPKTIPGDLAARPWYGTVEAMAMYLHVAIRAPWTTTYAQVAEELGIDRFTTRRCLIMLAENGDINIVAKGRKIIITTHLAHEPRTKSARNLHELTISNHPEKQVVEVVQVDDRARNPHEIRTKSARINKSRKVPMEDRKRAFAEACRKVVEADPGRLPPAERKAFFAYWTEPGSGGRGNMRFEAEKYFDHGRRMDQWMKNKGDWARFEPQAPEPEPTKYGWNRPE